MKKFIRVLDKKFEEYLLVFATIVMILLITFQVISRRFLNISLSWSEEISRYTFIWTVWMAVPYAVIKGRHIRLTILRDALNNKGKFILDMLFFLISAAFFIYVGIQGIELTGSIMTSNQVTPAVGIPKWICYVSLPIGCLLGAFRFAEYGVIRIKRYKKDPAENETFALEEEE